MNRKKILIPILLVIIILASVWFIFSLLPTKEEVERYFEENKCYSKDYCVYHMRRNTGMLFGQIFNVPWFVTPKFILYTTTPFNYYHDITHGEDEFHTYTWVDTRDGRFVYNVVNGEYVKKIDDKEDPAKEYYEDMKKLVEDILREQQEQDYYQESYQPPLPKRTALIVSSVSDGDTIQLSSGEEVRLIGLNAPEIGQKCSSEATNKLKELVLWKEVILEQDIDNKDQYWRLLRYVYVNDMFVNLELVRLGLAHKYEYGSNTKYSSQFGQAESVAKQNEGCLWKSEEEINYIQDQCIYVTNFHFNAAGNDNYNLNDEYVTLKNKCSYSIDMTSWTIKDETASHLYTIQSFTLQSGSTFTLFTGIGTNTNSILYWGRTSGDYAAIWNNGGDTLFLRDKKGNLVLSQSYSGY